VGLSRAFLAIVPPPEVLDVVEALLDRAHAASRFKWTRRAQWHVTMQYYGRVGDADALASTLVAACATRPPVTLRLRGGGAFPAPKRAAVYWLGVEDDDDALAFLHEAVIETTVGFVSRRDRTPFHPHLTLARLSSKLDLTADVDALAGVPVGPPFTATEMLLMESRTARGGAVYTEVARVPLAG